MWDLCYHSKEFGCFYIAFLLLLCFKIQVTDFFLSEIACCNMFSPISWLRLDLNLWSVSLLWMIIQSIYGAGCWPWTGRKASPDVDAGGIWISKCKKVWKWKCCHELKWDACKRCSIWSSGLTISNFTHFVFLQLVVTLSLQLYRDAQLTSQNSYHLEISCRYLGPNLQLQITQEQLTLCSRVCNQEHSLKSILPLRSSTHLKIHLEMRPPADSWCLSYVRVFFFFLIFVCFFGVCFLLF